MLQKATEDLEKEYTEAEAEKARTLSEKVPPLQCGGLNLQQLQVINTMVLNILLIS